MITEGRELSQFLSDFLWYLRNLLILKDQEGAEESLDMSKETIAALKEECSMVVLLHFYAISGCFPNFLIRFGLPHRSCSPGGWLH